MRFRDQKFRHGLDALGERRVLHPLGVLPQAAETLDPTPPLYEDETLIEVEKLHLDSASFRQLRESCGEDPVRIGEAILRIVGERGKMQNPVTGSGGMLLGRVAQLGPAAPARFQLGDRIATLVSLTLTPLRLTRLGEVAMHRPQISAQGEAILFASAAAVKLPSDLPEGLALAVFDVCGAPAWVGRMVKRGDRVLILGAGKSGVLAAAAAWEGGAEAWFCDRDPQAVERAMGLGLAAGGFQAEAQRPLALVETLRSQACPAFDLVVNACNAAETETAAILAARPGGKVLFFNMATQFSRAVLSAEGLGREVELVMGNGYALGHAELAIDLVRKYKSLKIFFEAMN